MLKRIKTLHDLGYIHRDLKPANFIIGDYKNSSVIYLIDFGIAEVFKNVIRNENDKVGLNGTKKFTSAHSQMGY